MQRIRAQSCRWREAGGTIPTGELLEATFLGGYQADGVEWPITTYYSSNRHDFAQYSMSIDAAERPSHSDFAVSSCGPRVRVRAEARKSCGVRILAQEQGMLV